MKYMKIKNIIKNLRLALVLLFTSISFSIYAENKRFNKTIVDKYCTIVDSYEYNNYNISSVSSDYKVYIVKMSAPQDKGLLIYFGKLYGNTGGLNIIFDDQMKIINPNPGSPYQLDMLLTYINPGRGKTVIFQTNIDSITDILSKLFFYEYNIADIEGYFPFVSEHNISSDIIVIPYIELLQLDKNE